MDRVVLLSDDFKQEIRKLRKQRKQIGTDLKKLVQKFNNNALPGKPCKGADGLSFKTVRMSDKSSNKGSPVASASPTKTLVKMYCYCVRSRVTRKTTLRHGGLRN